MCIRDSARAILHGQIWRIVTFLMWPLSGDLFLNVLVIYCYYNLGRTLEAVWGSFRFNEMCIRDRMALPPEIFSKLRSTASL